MKYYRIIKCDTLDNSIDDARIKDVYAINFAKIFSILLNIVFSVSLLISGAVIDRLVRGLDWEYVKNALHGNDKNKIELVKNEAIQNIDKIELLKPEPMPTHSEQVTKIQESSLNIQLPLAIPNNIPVLVPINNENQEDDENPIDVVIREQNNAPTSQKTSAIKETIIQNKD